MITVVRGGGVGTFGSAAGGNGPRAGAPAASAPAGAGEPAFSAVAAAGGIQSSSSDHSFIAGDDDGGVPWAGRGFLRRTARMMPMIKPAPSTPPPPKSSRGSISLLVSSGLAAAGSVTGVASSLGILGVAAGSASGVASFFRTERRGPGTGRAAGSATDCEGAGASG